MIHLMLLNLIVVMLATAGLIASFALNFPIIAPFAALIGMLAMGSFVLTFLIGE